MATSLQEMTASHQNAVPNLHSRTIAGQKLHGIIMTVAKSKDEPSFRTALREIKKFFDVEQNCVALLELSANECHGARPSKPDPKIV